MFGRHKGPFACILYTMSRARAYGSGLRYISFGHTRALGYASNVFVVFLVLSSLPAVLTRSLQGTSNSCLSQCGNVAIPYPFGTSPECGLPEFSLNCSSDGWWANAVLLLAPPCGRSGNFIQVTSISTNTLIISAIRLVTFSCDPTLGSGNATSACLGPASAPYVFTPQNNLFAGGCAAWGELYGDEFVGRCSTQGCNSTGQNEITDCTTPQFPKGARNITIYGGGNCGWASVIYLLLMTGEYGEHSWDGPFLDRVAKTRQRCLTILALRWQPARMLNSQV
jgi:hypothetical protein